MKPKTHIECKNEDCRKVFRRWKTTDKYCSPACKLKCEPPKPQEPRAKIKPFSDKRKAEMPIYSTDRKAFLEENKVCVIKGPTCTHFATTIEHSRGRDGYADEAKRLAGISLYLDKDYWKASCWNCNTELENNPELSREHQLSKIHGGKKEPKGGG